jgi:hypothetical protein
LIGNAVPVDLGRAIARSINKHLAFITVAKGSDAITQYSITATI